MVVAFLVVAFFHLNGHNSGPRPRTGTRIAGNESDGPPGAVKTLQGPGKPQEFGATTILEKMQKVNDD